MLVCMRVFTFIWPLSLGSALWLLLRAASTLVRRLLNNIDFSYSNPTLGTLCHNLLARSFRSFVRAPDSVFVCVLCTNSH